MRKKGTDIHQIRDDETQSKTVSVIMGSKGWSPDVGEAQSVVLRETRF